MQICMPYRHDFYSDRALQGAGLLNHDFEVPRDACRGRARKCKNPPRFLAPQTVGFSKLSQAEYGASFDFLVKIALF